MIAAHVRFHVGANPKAIFGYIASLNTGLYKRVSPIFSRLQFSWKAIRKLIHLLSSLYWMRWKFSNGTVIRVKVVTFWSSNFVRGQSNYSIVCTDDDNCALKNKSERVYVPLTLFLYSSWLMVLFTRWKPIQCDPFDLPFQHTFNSFPWNWMLLAYNIEINGASTERHSDSFNAINSCIWVLFFK